MKARDARDGQVYDLPRRGQQPAYRGAVCHGWNASGEFILFIIFDDQSVRKMTMVSPETEIIKAVN